MNFSYKFSVKFSSLIVGMFSYALHEMPARTSNGNEKGFRLSVRLSVKRVDCDKKEDRSAKILYHTKEHSLVF